MPIPAIVLSPQAMLLFNLLLQNAITLALNQISKMTPDEINRAIPVEEARNKTLTDELNSH